MLFGKQIAKCKSLFVFNRDPSRIQASKGSALTIKRDSHHHHHHHHPIFIIFIIQWLHKQPSKRQQSAGPKLDTFSLKLYSNKQKPSRGSFRSKDQAAKITGHPLGANAGTLCTRHRCAGRIFAPVFDQCFDSASSVLLKVQ